MSIPNKNKVKIKINGIHIWQRSNSYDHLSYNLKDIYRN